VPPDQTWKSKTETFRERMAEIKRAQNDDEAPVQEEAAVVETAVESEPEPAPAKKKKGCLGMIVFFVGVGLSGLTGLWHWLS